MQTLVCFRSAILMLVRIPWSAWHPYLMTGRDIERSRLVYSCPKCQLLGGNECSAVIPSRSRVARYSVHWVPQSSHWEYFWLQSRAWVEFFSLSWAAAWCWRVSPVNEHSQGYFACWVGFEWRRIPRSWSGCRRGLLSTICRPALRPSGESQVFSSTLAGVPKI